MTGFARDLTHAVRLIRLRPVSSSVIVVIFALGIGANTALFSVIKAVWLDTVPYPTAARAVQVMVVSTRSGGKMSPNMPELFDLRADANSPLEVTAALMQSGESFRITPDGPRFFANGVDTALFQIFPERPVHGRLLDAADQAEDRPVAVASYRFWQRALGGDPAAIGRPLTLTGAKTSEVVTLVGVLPERFEPFSRDAALLRPLRRVDVRMQRGSHGSETVFGLLPQGVSVEQARGRLDEIGKRWAAQEPLFQSWALTADPVRSVIAGANVERALAALVGVAALVLLIVCANVANLLVAGADDRRREMAVRASLGAGRGRLIRQLLSEALVLGLAGAAAALLLAQFTRGSLVALMPANLRGVDQIGIDGEVLAFSLTATLACTLLAAMWPALRLSQARPFALLASVERAGRSRGPAAWLLAAQIAAGVVVIVAGVLLARSFSRLMSVDPGFDPSRVLLITAEPPRTTPTAGRPMLIDQLLDEIRALPMVEAAGAAETLPLSANRARYSVRVEGSDTFMPWSIDYRRASPGYFQAMGIAVTRGRDFLTTDRVGAEPVALINENAAAALFPGGDAIGKRVFAGSRAPITIVGIVANVRHVGLDSESVPEIYRPIAQDPSGYVRIAVRSRVDDRSVHGVLLDMAATRRYGYALSDVRSADEHVGRWLREPWFRTVVFGVMGALVLVLTVLGVAALAALAVVRRTREIGIRLAIGSRPSQAVALLVRQAFAPAAAGAALGLATAWWATRAIGHFLFSIDARDLPSFAIAAIVMLAGAAIASWLPARRAARIDPAIALRMD